MGNYDDIINLPHHQSSKRPHMSLHDRAAQFAPFAALTGYAEEVAETARVTGDKIGLDDSEVEVLNQQLLFIATHKGEPLQVTVTHFVPDKLKEGGAYTTDTVTVKGVDQIAHTLVLTDRSEIEVGNILSLEVLKD